MKKGIFFIIIIFFITNNIYSSENIVNKIFFDDFKKIGFHISDDLFFSSILLTTSVFTTLILVNNDKFLKDMTERLKNDFNDKFFEYINYGGDAIYVLSFNSFLFLFSEKEKKAAKNLIECLAVNGLTNYSLKIILGRKRPSQTENPKDFDFFKFSDNSMPSGHTLVAFTWAEVLNDSYGIWYVTYPLAAMVGCARIYKNSHWVSDVFSGALLGVVLTKLILNKQEDTQITFNYNGNLSMSFIKYNF